MGLNKTYTNPSGVSVSYWKITNTNKSPLYKTCEIVLSGYTTFEAREANYEPVEIRRIKLNWGSYDTYLSVEVLSAPGVNEFIKLYEYIKTNETFFSDAVDVLETEEQPTP